LTELGIRILDLPLKTGLVAEIGQGEPIIALRADIDALPILEKTGLDYASINGAMHACGHDLHMTSLLGAAELLKARESQLTGTLRLFFQPAEEVATGAYAVIAAGGLDGVSAVLGYHNMPQLPVGVIGCRSKAIMAGVEKFKVTVTGTSSHAAKPEMGVDSVLAITSMVNNLQAIVARTVSPFDSVVLSVTHIAVGSTWNVLPKDGYFEGTIRTFTPSLKAHMREHFTRIVEATAAQFGATATIDWTPTPNVTYNDEVLTPLVMEKSRAFAQVIEVEPMSIGEDFAAYQEQVPGVFAFIGSNGADDAQDLHSDYFIIKDEVLPIAVNYYVENALMLLEHFGK
jgi:amidohydrolase